MTSSKFEPPKCGGCGKPLFAVYENEYWTYSFDKKTGSYRGNLADIEIRCPDCHAKLWDQFQKEHVTIRVRKPIKPNEYSAECMSTYNSFLKSSINLSNILTLGLSSTVPSLIT